MYVDLGPRGPFKAAADATGLNPGNLTTAITQDLIGIRIPHFELYHITIANVPSNTTLMIYRGSFFWDIAQAQGIASWDPAQALLMGPGQDLNILFNQPSSTTPVPSVTCWFRYDPAQPNNPEIKE